MGDSQISGTWTLTDHKLHINCLELKAVVSALQHWAPVLQIVNRIFRFWGTPLVDMFTTASNTHLPWFMSLIPEPRALVVDALSQNWQGRSMYMFPPFILLNKVIQKLWSTQAAEVILIAPWWPKQSWFPHLLRLCVDHPLFFPYRQDLLSQQDQNVCLGQKVVPSARIEALLRHYKAAGFSEKVSRLAAAAQIASFLFTLFDTHGLSPQTV